MGGTSQGQWLFEVKDPRDRIVRCSSDQWENHILTNRRWMADWKDEVIAAIKDPALGIYRSAQQAKRDIYYSDSKRRSGRYLKVVVEFASPQDAGIVITTFPVDSMPPGEKMIWPHSSD